MKVIDLLNKIANGEEVPKKIKTTYNDYTYTIWEYNGIDYMNKDNDYLFEVHTRINKNDLNEEVEIIEEEKKIPEKLDYCDENTFMFKCKENSYLTREEMRLLDSNFKELGNKINSIIDYLKSKGE